MESLSFPEEEPIRLTRVLTFIALFPHKRRRILPPLRLKRPFHRQISVFLKISETLFLPQKSVYQTLSGGYIGRIYQLKLIAFALKEADSGGEGILKVAVVPRF